MKHSRADDAEEQAVEEIVPPEPTPSDLVPLNDVIDRRCRYLLFTCTDPKDLTKAIEAVTAWVKVKGDQEGMKGWGDALRGGTTR